MAPRTRIGSAEAAGDKFAAVLPQTEERGGKKKKKKKKRGAPDPTSVRGVLKDEKKIQKGAGKIVEKDISLGERLGDLIAPDVTDEDFLDRIEATRGEEFDETLGRFDEARDLALRDDEDVRFALDTLKGRATEGFGLAERERLGFQARQGLQSTLQSGLRAAQAFNLGRGLTGGIQAQAFNPALIQAAQQRRGIENDILLAEQAERNRALSEFSGLAERQAQSRFSNVLSADQARAGALERQQLQETDIQKFNAAQRAKEIAARTAQTTTGIGLVQDERDIIRQEKLLREQLGQSESNIAQILSQA